MRNLTEFHRPKQLEEALNLLARSDVTIAPLAGGSDLIAHEQRDVQAVVDLRDLGLAYIRREGAALRVGATTTLQVLIDSPESAEIWNGELARVVELTTARSLREQRTLAGTLVAAAANNPLAVLLLALDASLTIEPGGKRAALDEFFAQRPSLLDRSLITEVAIPLPHSGKTAAFEKVSRTPADLPIVCAAVRAQIDSGQVRDVRIGLGGVGPAPVRATQVERSLEGQSLDRLSIEIGDEIDPPSDFLGSREYRREMAAVLIRRALERLHSAQ